MTNKPWLSSYPNGVPVKIDVSKYNSLIDYIEEKCVEYKSKDAFSCMGKTITYKKLNELATHFAAYLHSRGLVQGDRIALMMPNLLQYPIALIGALKAGLIIVNTNPLYTPREMEHQFTDSGVRAIVIADNFAANLEKIIDKTDIAVVITTKIGDMLGSVKGTMVNFMLKNVKRIVPSYTIVNSVNFMETLKVAKKFTMRKTDNSPDRVIVHQYTGGTTGVSKGAMLTNENILANIMQISAWFHPAIKEDKEIILTALPLYHIFAFTVNCLTMFNFGTKNILITNPRDIGSLVKVFKNNRITTFTAVNTLFNALLNDKTFQKLDFSNLNVVVGGGAAVQTAVNIRWKEVTGKAISEGYGMTEASPVVTTNPIDENCRIGSIGIPVPNTVVRVADEEDNEVAVGEIGELHVKGPQVMKGYYKNAAETAATIRNGWLCTGDIGLMDADGYFKIVDRKKDMILVSGFNVYPNEIEGVLATHDKVLEAAAIGVPDEKSGEKVKVFVVKKDKSLTKDELKQFSRENLTGYKVPKVIVFIKELPKTNVGKILRKDLRNL